MQSIWFKWQLTSWTSVQMDVEVPSSAGYTASSSSTITRLLLSALRIFSFSERYAVNALLLRSLLRLSFVRLSVKRSLRVNRTFFAARPITSPIGQGSDRLWKKRAKIFLTVFPRIAMKKMYEKIAIFNQLSFISNMIQDMAIVTTEDE